jgi:hypothetical protein
MLAADNVHLRIGHNGGPPLDVGYHAWVWRRAHAQAWTNPGREIVMLRLRQAERLGLDYRTYTSVLMDRGARLQAMLLMVDAETVAFEKFVAAKFGGLSDCKIVVCVPERFSKSAAVLLSRANSAIACPDLFDASSLTGVLSEGVLGLALPPSSVFMVGSGSVQRRAAERAGLGTFVEARAYFHVGQG